MVGFSNAILVQHQSSCLDLEGSVYFCSNLLVGNDPLGTAELLYPTTSYPDSVPLVTVIAEGCGIHSLTYTVSLGRSVLYSGWDGDLGGETIPRPPSTRNTSTCMLDHVVKQPQSPFKTCQTNTPTGYSKITRSRVEYRAIYKHWHLHTCLVPVWWDSLCESHCPSPVRCHDQHIASTQYNAHTVVHSPCPLLIVLWYT